MTHSDPKLRPRDEHRAPSVVEEAVEDGHDPSAGGAAVPPMRVREGGARSGRSLAPVEPWAEKVVRLLDDGLRVPGTELRFGLDGIIGFFFPGVGDMLTGAGSLSLLFLALQQKVPTVVIARMVLNIAFDTLLGSVPILGDLFDVLFKANRKNLQLVEKYRDDPEAEAGPLDYLLVGGAILLVLAAIALPILLLVWIAGGLFSLGQ